MKKKEFKFECKMKDGSMFRMPCKAWNEAFAIKHGTSKKVVDEIQGMFRDMVAVHWKDKTTETKFGTASWKSEKIRPKSHAALGESVMYPYIRVPLMGMMWDELGKEEDKKTGKKSEKGGIVALHDDGSATMYSGKKKRKIKNLTKALEEGKL